MSTIDRCTCPSAYGICDGPQIDCSVHGAVDGILARGWYVDRKSRPWHLRHDGNWQCDLAERKVCLVAAWYMRLLIERDLRRDECWGVRECQYHPVPRVFEYRGQFGRWSVLAAGADGSSDTARNDLTAAMDAARALAVDE